MRFCSSNLYRYSRCFSLCFCMILILFVISPQDGTLLKDGNNTRNLIQVDYTEITTTNSLISDPPVLIINNDGI